MLYMAELFGPFCDRRRRHCLNSPPLLPPLTSRHPYHMQVLRKTTREPLQLATARRSKRGSSGGGGSSRGSGSGSSGGGVSRNMLTWEVLREVYGICTYHMGDNHAYAGVVRTQNMLVQVSRTCNSRWS
jgi:hypothetical protein